MRSPGWAASRWGRLLITLAIMLASTLGRAGDATPSLAADTSWQHVLKGDVCARSDVATDARGYAYVVGTSGGRFEGQAGLGQKDIHLAAYDPAGKLVWARVIGTNRNDYVGGVTVGPDGSIYVVGSSFRPDNESEVLVAKFAKSGSPVWSRRLGANDGQTQVALDVASGRDGNIYFTGFVAPYPWENPCVFSVREVSSPAMLTGALHADGTNAWTTIVQPPGFAKYAVGFGVATFDGSVYVGGYLYTNPLLNSGVVWRLDGSGGVTWTRRVPMEFAYGVTGAGDAIYATGYGQADAGVPNDLVLSKLTPDGGLVWRRTLSKPGLGSETPQYGFDLKVAADGTILVLGATTASKIGNEIGHGGLDLLLAEFDATGDIQSVRLEGGSKTDYAGGLAFARGDAIYVSATTASPTFNGQRVPKRGGIVLWRLQ